MARLPDGHIITLRGNRNATITLTQRELVFCEHCKHSISAWENGKGGYCCTNHDGPIDENCLIPPDWFCADGERRGEDDEA